MKFKLRTDNVRELGAKGPVFKIFLLIIFKPVVGMCLTGIESFDVGHPVDGIL
jgi:hypothetical protein